MASQPSDNQLKIAMSRPNPWPIFLGLPYYPPSEDSDATSAASEANTDADSDAESESDIDSDGADPLERSIDRKNKLFEVDEDGDLMWHLVVTSYTKKEWIRRGRFTSRATYESSTPKELRQYTKDRGLPDPYPQGLTLKYFYLRLLDRDDEVKSFRFLDLIPELRNMVYKELLTFEVCPNCPAVHEPCHPGILRTSKQIYKEAKTILYANNEVHCRITASGPFSGYGKATFFASIHGRETTTRLQSHDRLDSLFYGMKHVPDYLRQVQKLHVDVVFNGGAKDIARFSLQSCLLNLASFLMDDHALKKLRIHIYDAADDDIDYTDMLDAIVYPLRRLRGINEVELTGVSDELKSAVIADMRSTTEPTFNTMKHMYQLQQEAAGYMSLVFPLNPYNGEPYCEPPPWSMGLNLCDDIQHIDRELGDFAEMDEEYNAFLDEDTELNTRRKMEDLKDCLAKVDIDDIDRRKQNYLESKATRADYLAKSGWVVPKDNYQTRWGEVRRNWKSRPGYEEW
jgi:hypothetical protein